MNVRVDLILKSEQRSASPLSLRSISRLASIFVPAALILGGVLSGVNLFTLQNRVRMAENAWEDVEPRRKAALDLREVADRNEGVLHELHAWRSAQIEWSDHLLSLQKAIRPQIQLTLLRVTQNLQITDDNVPARVFSAHIDGVAAGNSAERDVDDLQRMLTTVEPFRETAMEVTVPKFAADPTRKQDRVFHVQILFKPQVFDDETTGNQTR